MLALMVVMLRVWNNWCGTPLCGLSTPPRSPDKWTPAYSTRVSFDSSSMPGAIVGGSAPTTAQDRGGRPQLWEDGALHHHRDLASSPLMKIMDDRIGRLLQDGRGSTKAFGIGT
jgi:hypothetical protein